MKLEQLFEEVLREMTPREMKLYAPVKLNDEIDTYFIKLIDELDTLKRYILERKNLYKGYALIDVKDYEVVNKFTI